MNPLVVAALVLAIQTAPPTAPTLTELQKLQLQVLTQRIEIAQLRAQAVEREFADARTEFAAKYASLKVDGYRLDLQSLTYVPDESASPPVKK
jgi:hypothetical protein